MEINKKFDIIGVDGECEPIFILIKKHLDSIHTEKEFEEFRSSACGALHGCIGYMECMRFTDKDLLFRPSSSK